MFEVGAVDKHRAGFWLTQFHIGFIWLFWRCFVFPEVPATRFAAKVAIMMPNDPESLKVLTRHGNTDDWSAFYLTIKFILPACRVAVFATIALTCSGAFIASKVRRSIITAFFNTFLSGIGKGAKRSSQVQRMMSPEATPLAGGVWGGSRCPTKKG